MSEWQPIETAPRDKDEIAILICNARHARQMRVAYWDIEAAEPYKWAVEDAERGFNHHRDWPTHWMPLPPDPQASPTGEAAPTPPEPPKE